MRRVWLAFVLTPVVSLAVFILGAQAAASWATGEPWPRWPLLLDGSFYIYLLGYPIALVVELLIGLPTYHWLAKHNRLNFGVVTACASATGLATAPLLGWGEPRAMLVLAVIGIAMGAGGGATFSLIAFGISRRVPGAQ